jgi:glucosamine--fructose-6-phosphate aminotransferase (isomerizing)
VASTKAFTTQLTVLLMLVAKLARLKGLDASLSMISFMACAPLPY